MGFRLSLPRLVFAALALALPLLLLGARSGAPAVERAGAATCPYASQALGSLSRNAMQASVACLINADRVAHGLVPLIPDSRLYVAARRHNYDMQYHLHRLTHAASNGDSLSTRIRRTGYMSGASSWAVGEIIAYGWGSTRNPTTIMNWWLNSTSHRVLIRRASFRHFGVAAAHGTPQNRSAYGGTFTVDFGRRSP